MCGIFGIDITDNLRKDLGVSLIHGRVMKNTCCEIVVKVKNKLSCWKSSCHIVVRRTTLMRLLTVAILTYLMAIALFTKGAIEVLDSFNRRFIWGQ